MFQKCFKSFLSCLFALKSTQLPEHKEGLFDKNSVLGAISCGSQEVFCRCACGAQELSKKNFKNSKVLKK